MRNSASVSIRHDVGSNLTSQRPYKPTVSLVLTARSVLEGKLELQRERLSIQLRVRIDKIVERVALLRRIQANVSSNGELHAIVVMCSEEIVFLIRMLPSLRGVHGDPAVGFQIELRPTVVARDGTFVLVGRKGKTDFEARRDSSRPHHADKQ